MRRRAAGGHTTSLSSAPLETSLSSLQHRIHIIAASHSLNSQLAPQNTSKREIAQLLGAGCTAAAAIAVGRWPRLRRSVGRRTAAGGASGGSWCPATAARAIPRRLTMA